MKLSTSGPLNVLLFAFEFQLINIIDVLTAAIYLENMVALSLPQF